MYALIAYCIKAQVRDLHCIGGNLDPNCIIRHMLTKWTDYQPGICGWGIRMALKVLGMRKYVSSGLASCMFTIQCISIIFCCLLFMYYYWIAWGSAAASQAKCNMLHLSWTLICVSDCRCLYCEVASQLGSCWWYSLICWSYQNRQLLQDLITCYQMGLSI